MQIRALKINNFRGISTLDWESGKDFCCFIGPGDSGKSTVLDAVEACLSSRWFNFSESDFLKCDTSNTVLVEVTVGELSKQLKSDERFGLYIRGWTSSGKLRDEPEEDDEPVLTVRLTVDATLEPVWELVCDRTEYPKTLSNRERALFGLVRLAGDDARHLAWGHGSVLSRLTGDKSEAAALLAQAYKTARDSSGLDKIESLNTTAASAEAEAKKLGAYVDGSYGPGLELGLSGISAGSIALHDDGVPLRLAGLGTRRLATLAIQRSAIIEGAIVLIDEIEHGLEPHRIIGVISQLKLSQAKSLSDGNAVGQILITTHSDVAVLEVGAENLFVFQADKASHETVLIAPEPLEPIRDLLRFNPKALFARKILVVEGYTEVGLILGLRGNFATTHETVSIEQLGVAVVDGNGDQAVGRAVALSKLGYEVALYRDSDKQLTSVLLAELAASHIRIFEYEGNLNTEQAIFFAASEIRVQELIEYVRNERTEESVNGSLHPLINGLDATSVKDNFNTWSATSGLNLDQLKQILIQVALKQSWFKDSRVSREIAPIVWSIVCDDAKHPISKVIKELEVWLYA